MLFFRYAGIAVTTLATAFTAVADTTPPTVTEALSTGVMENPTVSAVAEISRDMSPLGMYLSAHPIVQGVLWILLLCSVLTWIIFFTKSVQLTTASRRLKQEQHYLIQQPDFKRTRAMLPNTRQHHALKQFIAEIEDELIRSDYHCDDDFKQRIDYRLDRQIQSLTQNMRYGISPLATIGAVAPFIGLFGTVWGIMNSFIGIVHAQTASLSVVAPGIAEALFATALGLVAAIPAVVIYNVFNRRLNIYGLRIGNLVAVLRLMIKRDISLQRLSSENE
ncbi:hypothetical protein A1D23_07440 [Chelonobacter oris]|uniref:tonB-system energizer ExbB n=1 Tax=Chelonobacter oris TaxID=505317 RepID=UPI00244BC0CA|nr:tonB-system energizer ExbB [Chelonobacter oris]MDH2999923.1 hypothetical protein [Chelonobacter oris]